MIISKWVVARPSYQAFYTDAVSEHILITAQQPMVLTKIMLNQRSDAAVVDFDRLSGEYRFEYQTGDRGRTIIFISNQGGSYHHPDGDVKLRGVYVPIVEFIVERGADIHSLIRFPRHDRQEMVYDQESFKLMMKPGDKLKTKVTWPTIKTWQDRVRDKTVLTSRQRDQLNRQVGYLNIIAQGIDA